MVNDQLRARIAGALAAAGIAGARDSTNTKLRPQWRLSFSWSGERDGERAYIHVYVPADADRLQVNCAAPAPALDSMPKERLDAELAKLNASYRSGEPGRDSILRDLGATTSDVRGWDTTLVAHQGFEHRMILGRVTMPLASISDASVGLAVSLGLRLATAARESLTIAWNGSPEEQ